MSHPDNASVNLCSWDERIVQSIGWLVVEEQLPSGDVVTHRFCSHDHLRRWAEQVMADAEKIR